jgi:hypothetical protein
MAYQTLTRMKGMCSTAVLRLSKLPIPELLRTLSSVFCDGSWVRVGGSVGCKTKQPSTFLECPPIAIKLTVQLGKVYTPEVVWTTTIPGTYPPTITTDEIFYDDWVIQ